MHQLYPVLANWFRSCWPAGLMLLCCSRLFAQESVVAISGGAGRQAPVNSVYAMGRRTVQGLTGPWTSDDGKGYSVPFFRRGAAPFVLRYTMDRLADTVKGDDFLFYATGIVGRAGLYCNDRLLGVVEDAWAENIYTIDRSEIINGATFAIRFFPKDPLGTGMQDWIAGVGGEMVLLSSRSTDASPLPEPVRFATRSDSALVMTTLSALDAGDSLKLIRQTGYPALYLPFRPSSVFLVMASRAGLEWSLTPNTGIVDYFPSFPSSQEVFPLYRYYGPHPVRTQPDRTTLIVLLLITFAFLVFLRAYDPRTLPDLAVFIFNPFLFLDSSRAGGARSGGLVALYSFFRVFLSALFISLFIHYWTCEGTLSGLILLGREGLVHDWVYRLQPSLATVFLLTFVVLVVWNATKFLLLGYLGTIYRIHGIASLLPALEVPATFPLNLVILIPGVMLFFISAAASGPTYAIWTVLIGLFFVRRIAVIFMGFQLAGKVPAGMKIFYICALEIMPWLVLL